LHLHKQREQIDALPFLYGALARLGIGVSVGLTLAVVGMMVVYGLLLE
jgi:hypothetical protein